MAEFAETTTYAVNCPSCASEDVIKAGQQNDQQRFRCKSCQKIFRNNAKVPGHKFTYEQIGGAVRLYYSGVSYRQLAETFRDLYGIGLPSKRTLFEWVAKYTDKASFILKDTVAKTGDRWVADEMFVRVHGRWMYHWNVMDAKTRYLLASYLSPRRDLESAVKVLRMALAKAGHPPKWVVTDQAPSYPTAIRMVLPGAKHIESLGVDHPINNNMSERMQGTFRSREKTLRGMDSLESGRRFLNGFVITYNHIRDHSAIKARTPAEAAKIDVPITEWADVVRSDVVVPQEAKTIRHTRISSLESLPRDINERKRIQRRKRRAARRAELKAHKKTGKQWDGTVPMFDAKTLEMTSHLKRAIREAQKKYGSRLRQSKPAAPKPLVRDLPLYTEARPGHTTPNPIGTTKMPKPGIKRPNPPNNHQPRLL